MTSRYTGSTIGDIDIARLSTQERLDLIGELWGGLAPEHVVPAPAQEAELARRIEAFDLHRDLWAKLYIDEALTEIEHGDVVPLEDHEARMTALMAKLGAT